MAARRAISAEHVQTHGPIPGVASGESAFVCIHSERVTPVVFARMLSENNFAFRTLGNAAITETFCGTRISRTGLLVFAIPFLSERRLGIFAKLAGIRVAKLMLTMITGTDL
jgi:hypothetical protein